MALIDNIADFIRDGQYRIAEISDELLNEIYDENSDEYRELENVRDQIWAFLQVLYYGQHQIYQSNQSGLLNDFTENELNQEIEHIRSIANISEVPWITFPSYHPTVVQNFASDADGSGEETDPTNTGGTAGQWAVYISETEIAGSDIPKYIGHFDVADINTYFQRELDLGYLLHPAYTASEWSTENPLLQAGEIGFELNGSGAIEKWKVGPGRWNDLSYFGDVLYTLTTTSNPIGDATGDLSGQTLKAVIEKMLNPYVAPVISNVQNDAGGAAASETILNIGDTLSGSVNISYDITNEANLDGSTPINITAGGIFSNEGDFAHGSPINLTLATGITPTTLTNIEIKIKATHTNGETAEVSTFIRFQPQIITGVSQQDSLTGSEIASIADKKTFVTDAYARTYQFDQAGYLYIAIPSTLSPSNLEFADATNSLLALPIDMTDVGVVSVNNGITTYNYQVFRSTYNITENLTKIAVQ